MAALMALAWPVSGYAEGALAIGAPQNVAKSGIAFGYANNKPSADEAIQRALELCRTAPSSDEAHGLCTLVRSYHDECVAVSMDPINHTLKEAEENAMANCEATAGPDRRGHCEASASSCDGSN